MSIAAAVTARSRLTLAGVAVLSAAARVAVVVTALRVGAEDSTGAVVVGVASGALLLLQRAFVAHARTRVESDLRRATVKAILAADVVDEPATPFDQPVYESSSHAIHYLTDVIPELVASAVAFAVVLPMLFTHLAGRFVMIAGAALLALAAGFVLVRAAAARAQRALGKEYAAMYESLADAIGGRLEIVASGQRSAFENGFDTTLARLGRVAARTGPLLSFLGRVPLALGAGVLGLIVLVDPDARQAFQSTILAQAVLLAAAAPIVLGIPLRAQEVVRARVRIAPLDELLARPLRTEPRGTIKPKLPAVIAARDIEFAYEEGIPVVRGLSFDWTPGTVLVLEGPNGSGKSTLLRLLVGLRPVSAGTITIDGAPLDSLDIEALRAAVAYLPQRPYFGESTATVSDALRFPERAHDEDAMKEALVRVGLSADALARRVWSLSGGQRQRLAIARMLLVGAPVWLLDEPDASLDVNGVKMLVALVREQVAAGRMIAIAAHTDLVELEGVRVSLKAQ